MAPLVGSEDIDGVGLFVRHSAKRVKSQMMDKAAKGGASCRIHSTSRKWAQFRHKEELPD